jgi:hypothetical protein
MSHTLCFKYSNGTYDPILDIYVPRAFQWYKELFNPMSFAPCYRFLKIQKSIGTPTSKMRTHLGMCGFIPSHPPTFPGAWNVIFEFHFRPTSLHALAMIVSLRLKLCWGVEFWILGIIVLFKWNISFNWIFITAP